MAVDGAYKRNHVKEQLFCRVHDEKTRAMRVVGTVASRLEGDDGEMLGLVSRMTIKSRWSSMRAWGADYRQHSCVVSQVVLDVVVWRCNSSLRVVALVFRSVGSVFGGFQGGQGFYVVVSYEGGSFVDYPG